MKLTKQNQANISSNLSTYLALILLDIIKYNPDYLLLDSAKFMDAREGDNYAVKVSLSGLGEGSSLTARNLGKSRLGGL